MKLNSIILGISPVGDGFPVVTERPNGDIVIENGKISAVSNDIGFFAKQKSMAGGPTVNFHKMDDVLLAFRGPNFARSKPTESGGTLLPMAAFPNKLNPAIVELPTVEPRSVSDAATIAFSIYVNPIIGKLIRPVNMSATLMNGGCLLEHMQELKISALSSGDSLFWVDLSKELQEYITTVGHQDIYNATNYLSRSLKPICHNEFGKYALHNLHKDWLTKGQYAALVCVKQKVDATAYVVYVYPPQVQERYALDDVVEKQIPSIEDAPDSDDGIDVGLSDVFMMAIDAFMEGVTASCGNLVYVGADLLEEDALDKVKTIATLQRDNSIHCLRISATTLKEILDSDNPFIRPEVLSYRVESNPVLDPINLRGVHDINVFGHYAKTIDMWFVGIQMNGDTFDYLLDN